MNITKIHAIHVLQMQTSTDRIGEVQKKPISIAFLRQDRCLETTQQEMRIRIKLVREYISLQNNHYLVRRRARFVDACESMDRSLVRLLIPLSLI